MRRSPTRALLRAALLALAVVVLAPGRASAHLGLAESYPREGATVGPPLTVRLTFTEPVALAFSRITLRGPGGEVQLEGLELASPTELRALVPDSLPPGHYTVLWQAAGADGHAIRDSYSFELLPAAVGPAPAAVEAPDPAPDAQADSAPVPASVARSPFYTAVRWLSFVGLLGVIGAVAFRLLVLGRSEAGALEAARVGLLGAGLLAATLAGRFAAQWLSVRGEGESLTLSTFFTMLGRTLWGWGWLAQAAAIAVAAAGFALARRNDRAGWRIAACGALALAFTPALSGHAVSAGGLAPLAVLADGLHVLGAGGWLGTLLLVALVALPAGGERAVELVRAFSPVALGCAALVVLTGGVAAWIHLGGVAELWRSGYGRLLLLKLAVLAGVLALGAYHWRRSVPALGAEGAVARLRRSASVELALGALVLAVTAVLVATAAP